MTKKNYYEYINHIQYQPQLQNLSLRLFYKYDSYPQEMYGQFLIKSNSPIWIEFIKDCTLNDNDLESEYEQKLAYSIYHIILSKQLVYKFYQHILKAENLLDLAYQQRQTSRLECYQQVNEGFECVQYHQQQLKEFYAKYYLNLLNSNCNSLKISLLQVAWASRPYQKIRPNHVSLSIQYGFILLFLYLNQKHIYDSHYDTVMMPLIIGLSIHSKYPIPLSLLKFVNFFISDLFWSSILKYQLVKFNFVCLDSLSIERVKIQNTCFLGIGF
ncbi:unnamed protein product [Paramecium octaurelia]|uniref:Uncharacterized protein n=1 Tax=Paramecium octaurelia TaxID=43137 RepID=A0A8S1XXG7_PAROT|nr:unnamed protein product [Paramecium octaurelia]